MNKLFIIPTPIGNLNDFTLRSIEILKKVKYILCEDTKVTGKIKSHLNLDAKLISLHKFNEHTRVHEVKKILMDNDIALVSDAGTPTISDPGQILIKELKKEGSVDIVPLPGSNAITTALSGSGLKFNSFTFVGFFDKEKNKIVASINKNLNSDVIVAYESPNRINKTLSIILEEFGDIEIVIARELTKMYEEFIENKISLLINKKYKGEIVLLIPTNGISIDDDFKPYIDNLIKFGLGDKDIIYYLTTVTKFKKNTIYNYIKELKNKTN